LLQETQQTISTIQSQETKLTETLLSSLPIQDQLIIQRDKRVLEKWENQQKGEKLREKVDRKI